MSDTLILDLIIQLEKGLKFNFDTMLNLLYNLIDSHVYDTLNLNDINYFQYNKHDKFIFFIIFPAMKQTLLLRAYR